MLFILPLAAMMLLAGCSKPAKPVAAKPVKKTETKAVAKAEEKLPLESEAKTASLFREYARQLKSGDLIQASANLASLEQELRGSDLADPFWEEQIPQEHRITLLISALCTACTDGSCATCKGRRACVTCGGTGECKACGGKGGDLLACTSCICRTCNGSRFCQECKARRYIACSACGGSGNGKEEQKFDPCSSCGGRGYKEGLKGPNGSGSRIKCLRCNGLRGVYTTVRTPCTVCDGSGRKACPACSGTGACAACRGVGRNSDCQICSGQGRYLDPCKVCSGEKTCLDCKGTKLCKTCKGRGSCVECGGRHLVIRHHMPIDRRWLALPDARVVMPGPDESLTEIPLKGTAASFMLNNRPATADVPSDSMLWASAPEDLRLISKLFKSE